MSSMMMTFYKLSDRQHRRVEVIPGETTIGDVLDQVGMTGADRDKYTFTVNEVQVFPDSVIHGDPGAPLVLVAAPQIDAG